MAKQKSTANKKSAAGRTAEISNQLENAFLAGLGALSHPQDIRSNSFEALVEKGETFREKATNKTEELIDVCALCDYWAYSEGYQHHAVDKSSDKA